jgi:hypothetical protein
MIGRSFVSTHKLVVSVCAVLSVAMVWCASAVAGEAAAPGYHVLGYAFPAENLPPGGEGSIELHVYNDGAAMTSGEGPTLVDTLPEGLTATGGEVSMGGSVSAAGEKCSGEHVVVCHLAAIPAEESRFMVIIPVRVAASASGEALDRVRIEGGGAAVVSNATVPVRYNSQPAPAGFSNIDGWASNADGRIDTQAGSHPYQFTFAFAMNSYVNAVGQTRPVGGEERALNVNLPPGFTGDITGLPQCPRAVFDEGAENGTECPSDTWVGEDELVVHGGLSGGGGFLVPIYNIVPPPGVVAEFGFGVSEQDGLLDVRLRSGGNDGLTVQANNIIELGLTFNAATFWGVPGEHNGSGSRRPYLRLPTSCGAPLRFSAELLGTWENPNVRAQASSESTNEAGEPGGLTGCERLTSFEPTVSLTPETSLGNTASGLTADVHVPQGTNGEELATSDVKNVTVTLPEGLVLNPGQATGLVACQPSQENLGGPEAEAESEDAAPSCPSASKVGTAEVTTPLLPDKLLGNVYILQQNPPNIQLLVAVSGDGVSVKLVGNVHLDEATGRLTTTFANNPDLPFSDFKLTFDGGAQAAVVTPQACGSYESRAELTPWSDPLENIVSASEFQIMAGPGGSACAAPSFSPSFQAGTVVNQAGGFSPMSVVFSRQDTEQDLAGVKLTTPPGLSAVLKGVERCGEPQAGQGTCGAGSLIGHTTVTAGPGAYPLTVPGGQVFLTGPYKGAPFGLSIVVPAIAGPFNLGNVVVRAAVSVDPRTAQITIVSDPFPTILDGVPLQVKSVSVSIDRQGFIFNPTSCEPSAVNGAITSTQGAQAAVSNRFQVAGCASLPFKPSFTVSTQAKTSKAKGASLTVKYTSSAGQANTAKVDVTLPKQLPARLTTIQQACTEAAFNANPASCPVASDIGTATAVTPILTSPLTGPVYLVSHGGAAFPDVVAILQGEGISIDLTGNINIAHSVTSASFNTVPDAPISTFTMVLPEGPHSGLSPNLPKSAKYSMCGQSLTMPTSLTGQNGAVVKQTTKVSVTGCAKAKKKVKKKSKHKKPAKAKRRG